MGSVNRVFLAGVVATPPREVDGVWQFTLGVPVERDRREWLERCVVSAAGPCGETVTDLHIGQAVYVDGRLAGDADGVVVVASTIIVLGDAPAEPATQIAPEGTHASPCAHQRAGHPRRLHLGTPRERVVWVRSTTVRPRAAAAAPTAEVS